MKTIGFKITGMHCASCKTLIEEDVGGLDGVKRIVTDFQTGNCTLEYDEEIISREKIFSAIKKLNYEPSDHEMHESPKKGLSIKKKYLITGILLLLFLAGLFLIRYYSLFDVMSYLSGYQLGFGLIIFIGLLASFHCVGMCGGFVVAYSTKALKENEGKKILLKPHLLYNLGRIISYTVIGGILGGFGAFFAISPEFTSSVILIAGVFMVLMGLSFFGKLRFLSKLKLRTPAFIARILYRQSKKGTTSPF